MRKCRYIKTERNVYYVLCCICLIMCGIIAGICVHKFHIENRSLGEIIVFAGAFAVALILYICAILFGYSRNKLSIDMLVRIVIWGGFILRLIYITYTPITVRSDDVYTINDTGHMGYIYYIFSNFRFPSDPASGWEFPQPPLHHILAAIWMRILTTVGISVENACEGIQYLTSLYTTITAVVVDKIYRELSSNKKGRIFAVLCATYYPYMIVMSGDINNDALLTLLMMITILFTIRWWKTSTMINIVYIAVGFGLAMMTKYSAVLLVPSIALIFLVRFFKDKNYLMYIKQFMVFLTISVPISFYWPIRLKLKYNLDFGFIQKSSIQELQYIGGYSVFERLFSFRNKLNHSYIVWDNTSNMCDYNIFVNLIKTGTFGEQDFITYNPAINLIGDILFFIMIVFTLIMLGSFCYWCVNGDCDSIYRIFCAGIVLLVGISPVIRTLTPDMAFIFSSNIRFIMSAVLLSLIILGLLMDRMNKVAVNVCYYMSGSMVVLSSTMWILCVMYH